MTEPDHQNAAVAYLNSVEAASESSSETCWDEVGDDEEARKEEIVKNQKWEENWGSAVLSLTSVTALSHHLRGTSDVGDHSFGVR